MPRRPRSPEPSLVTMKRASGSAETSSSSDSDDEDTYIVEAVLEFRVGADGNDEYLVKWEGYSGDEATTWEPEENLNCRALLHEFKVEQKRKKEEKARKELQKQEKAEKAAVSLEIGSSSEEEERPRPKPRPKAKGGKGKAKAVEDRPVKKAQAAVNGSPAAHKTAITKSSTKTSKLPSAIVAAPLSSAKRPREDSPPRPRPKPNLKKKAKSVARDSSSESEDLGQISPPKAPVASSSAIKRPVSSSNGIDKDRKPPSSAPAPGINHSRPSFMDPAPSKLSGLPSFRKVLTDPTPKESPPAADEFEIEVQPYGKSGSPQSPHRNPVPSTSSARHPNGLSTNGQPSLDRKPSAPYPRPTSGPFSMPGSSKNDDKPSSVGKAFRTPASVIARMRTGDDAQVAAAIKEEVDRKVEQLKQDEERTRADQRGKKKITAQSRFSDLEGRLKSTDLYSTNLPLFEARTTPVACAELLGMDAALVLSMRNRYCTFIQAGGSNEDHEAEHVALGLLLLAIGAESPPSIPEIQVAFVHRAAPFDKVFPLLVDLFLTEHHVQLFSFGDGQPVAPMFSQGYFIVPTLAALRQADQLDAFSPFLARHPTSTLMVHPASIVLGRSALPQTWKTIADTVVADIVPSQDLPSTSRLVHSTSDLILSLSDPNQTLAEISIHDELAEIELYLTELRPAHPERHRRYVIVLDREGDASLEKRLKPVGIEVMSWSGLTASMKRSIY